MHYKSTQENAEQYRARTGGAYVLRGACGGTRSGANHGQLIRTGDQTRLWTKEFDRELQSWLAVAEEIALETADEISRHWERQIGAPNQARAVREGYEAYDQYLKGLYFLNKRPLPGFETRGCVLSSSDPEKSPIAPDMQDWKYLYVC